MSKKGIIHHMINLDHNATTNVYKDVVKYMHKLYLDQSLGNPSSRHCMGGHSRKLLEDAREIVAKCLGVSPSYVIFTSGATESINMFILGRARLITPDQRVRFVTSNAEHPAVTNTFNYIQRTMHPQIEVCILPTKMGLMQLEDVRQVLGMKDRKVELVSVSYVNHELGSVLTRLRDISRMCHEVGALVHSDMTQAIGKMEVRLGELEVDAVSFSGHKFHGPMGVGCLVMRPEIKLEQLMFGGDQENKRRPGTENLVGICGMVTALQKSLHDYPIHRQKYIYFHQLLFESLASSSVPFRINACPDKIATTISISIGHVEASKLVEFLNQKQICVSRGTACKAYSTGGSNVIKSLELPPEYANGTIRISLGENTSEQDIIALVQGIKEFY